MVAVGVGPEVVRDPGGRRLTGGRGLVLSLVHCTTLT